MTFPYLVLLCKFLNVILHTLDEFARAGEGDLKFVFLCQVFLKSIHSFGVVGRMKDGIKHSVHFFSTNIALLHVPGSPFW